MKLIILNKDGFFKEGLYELIKSKGNTLVLGYKYLRKTIFDKAYSRDFKTSEDKYIADSKKQTRDKFRECILEGFRNENNEIVENATIKIISGNKEDKNDAVGFAFELEKILDEKNINIELYINRKYDYNKNVAMKLQEENIKVLIIGSSNLSTYTIWNRNDNYIKQETDIIIYDQYALQNEEEVIKNFEYIDRINQISTHSKYAKKLINDGLAKTNAITTINSNHYIISPIEVYKIKEEILDELNYDYLRIIVDKNKLEILKLVYDFYIDFYREKDKSKASYLKSRRRVYKETINKKDIIKLLEFISEDDIISNLRFNTSYGVYYFKELILKILELDLKEVSNLFIKEENQYSFINYYQSNYLVR